MHIVIAPITVFVTPTWSSVTCLQGDLLLDLLLSCLFVVANIRNIMEWVHGGHDPPHTVIIILPPMLFMFKVWSQNNNQ